MLDRSVELDVQPLPEPIERRIDIQLGEIALSGAEIARRVEADLFLLVIEFADQNAILEQADQVVPEIQFDQSSTEHRMVTRKSEFPRALRLQIRVAAIDAIG